MAWGHVMAWCCNASGNVMGTAHTNLILDIRMYQVEFTRGKVTELIANIIAESVYIKCDANGNEYLLLDALIGYYKDNKAISLTDQQTSIWGRPVTCKTTVGWQIFCQWKDCSTSWEKL